jgi:transcriptional regulator with XRE-family HTH domain
MESYARLKQHFGTAIRQLRTEKAVSQQIMADHCDLERAYVSRLERGISEPSLSTVFKISEYFGMTPSDLVATVSSLARKTKK